MIYIIKIKIFKVNYKLIAIVFFILTVLLGIMVMKSEANSEKKEAIKLPIIMYHSILKDKSKSGEFTVTPTTLENDLKYIKEKGYNTITMEDLIEYVYDNEEIPENPIVITFDDGYYNNYGYVLPLLKKYDMKAVISIVGEYTDKFSETGESNLNYSYMRWEDIEEAMEEEIIEFQNHSYSFHSETKGRKGSMKKKGESLEQYRKIFTQDLSKLQEEFKEHTDYEPTTYTYPFGAVSKESLQIVKDMGFKASLSCSSGINLITRNPECLYLLKRNNRPNGIETEKFFNKILGQ